MTYPFKLAAISILLLFHIQLNLLAQFSGKIFIDDNGNEVYDKGESLIKEAVVSDGLHIVRTGPNGTYELPGWEKARFISLYPGSHFYTSKRFHRIQEGQTEYHFPVLLKDKKEEITFLHISDTETYEAKEWYNDLRAYINNHKPDFLVYTGDICYRAGLDWHAKHALSNNFGIPTYYCLSNHDLIAGDYGEQYFEEKFGPAWYAFEEGNVLYVITPMMSGDFKPGFTRKEIGSWMKNLLSIYPKAQPKYFFNHDILSQSENFSFHINATDSIYLNAYNLKAWVYGHWHNNTYMQHGDAGIQSYCVSPAAKGGIDHSPSSMRVFKVDKKGNSQSTLRWTFVDKTINIVSPLKNRIYKDANGKVKLLVNVYDSESEIDSVRFAVYGQEGFSWNSALNKDRWRRMNPVSDWTWEANYTLEDDSRYEVVVYAYAHSGDVLQDKSWFSAGKKEEGKARFNLSWVQNAGGNIFMGSPLVRKGNIICSVFDDGDADNAYIICLDERTGEIKWKYPTKNSIKNQMVLVDGKVIGTDSQGYTYAVDVAKGSLVWEIDLKYHRLSGFVSGIATDGTYVYTGFGKSLVALDASNGNIKWTNSAWQGGEGSTPTMLIADDLLIASSNWRALYAHNKETGVLVWSRKDADLRFRDGTVSYFNDGLWVAQDSSKIGLLRKLDMQSGKTIRSFPTGISNRSTSAPVFIDDKIIVAGSHPGIIAMDMNGKLLWKTEVEPSIFYTPQYYSDKQQTIESTPLLIDNSIIFGAMDGYVYCLNQETGYIEQKVFVGAPILGNATKTKDGFVVADFAGNVYKFEWIK